jgi:hypothetical protein
VRAVAVTVNDRRLVFADNRIFELTDSIPRALFGNGSIDPIIEGGPALGGAVRVTSMTTDGDDIVIAELAWIRRLRPGSTPIIVGHLERFFPPEGGFPQDSLATGTPLSTGVHIGFDDEGRLLSVDEARSLMRVEADGTASRREISTLLRPTLISSRAGRTVAADGAFSGCVFVNEDGSQTPAGCSVSEGPRALAQDRLGQVIFPDFFGQPPRTINRLNLDGSVTRIAGAGFGAPTIDGRLCPDITEEAPRRLGLQRAQQQEWLRFSSTHWNEGPGTLQIRGGGQTAPCQVEEAGTVIDSICTYSTQEVLNSAGDVVYTQPAGRAVFHPDHHHWHQDLVADFVLRSGSLDGPIVAQATKVTYCLIDFDAWNGLGSDKTYIDCNSELQGISAGFGDEYHHSTEGQEVDVTQVPAGIYHLTHEADPSNKWLEWSDANNTSWTKFELKRTSGSGNGKIVILEESACTGLACGNTSNR